MKFSLTKLAVLVMLCSISSVYAQAFNITPRWFTENSSYDLIEKSNDYGEGIVQVSGCTGFLVANSLNKTIMGTARHCFGYNVKSWCDNGGSVTHFVSGQKSKCIKVAVGSQDGSRGHDIILLEMEEIKRNTNFDFNLSTKVPSLNEEIYMLGFPAVSIFGDEGRGQLIRTFNCIVNSDGAVANWYARHGHVGRNFTHNCGTYGGNSGGPMIIDGTRTVIGLPYRYKRSSSPQNPLESSSKIEGLLTSDFIELFSAEIEKYQLILN
jgi:hypothetical protein